MSQRLESIAERPPKTSGKATVVQVLKYELAGVPSRSMWDSVEKNVAISDIELESCQWSLRCHHPRPSHSPLQ